MPGLPPLQVEQFVRKVRTSETVACELMLMQSVRFFCSSVSNARARRLRRRQDCEVEADIVCFDSSAIHMCSVIPPPHQRVTLTVTLLENAYC